MYYRPCLFGKSRFLLLNFISLSFKFLANLFSGLYLRIYVLDNINISLRRFDVFDYILVQCFTSVFVFLAGDDDVKLTL